MRFGLICVEQNKICETQQSGEDSGNAELVPPVRLLRRCLLHAQLLYSSTSSGNESQNDNLCCQGRVDDI